MGEADMIGSPKNLYLKNMKGFEYLVKFLKEEGFRYDEEDSLLSFKVQGLTFNAFKGDTPLLQIFLSFGIEGQNRSKLLELCNSLNQDLFVIKFTVNKDSNRVWCSYEFEPNASTTSDDFMLVFDLSHEYAVEFLKKLK